MGFNDRMIDTGCISYEEICPKCHKKFKVLEYEQVPGFRSPDDLFCPHCHYVIKTSMEYEFVCLKMK